MRHLVMAGLAVTSLVLCSDARADVSCKVLFTDLLATANATPSVTAPIIHVGVSTTQPGVDYQSGGVGLWGQGYLVKGSTGITPSYKQVPILKASSWTVQRSSADTFTTTAALQISIYDLYGTTTLSSTLLGGQTLTSTTCSGNVMWGFDQHGRLHVLTFTRLFRVL